MLASHRQPLRLATENFHSWLRLLPRRRVNSRARVMLECSMRKGEVEQRVFYLLCTFSSHEVTKPQLLAQE